MYFLHFLHVVINCCITNYSNPQQFNTKQTFIICFCRPGIWEWLSGVVLVQCPSCGNRQDVDQGVTSVKMEIKTPPPQILSFIGTVRKPAKLSESTFQNSRNEPRDGSNLNLCKKSEVCGNLTCPIPILSHQLGDALGNQQLPSQLGRQWGGRRGRNLRLEVLKSLIYIELSFCDLSAGKLHLQGCLWRLGIPPM